MDGVSKPGVLAFFAERIDAKASMLRWAAGGTGITIAYAAIKAVEQRPELLTQLLQSGGLYVAFGIVVLAFAARVLARFSQAQERTATAQEQLAANVGALVAKNDTTAEVQRADMRFLASEVAKFGTKLDEVLKGQGPKQ